jgi:FkbM family methyltransferase
VLVIDVGANIGYFSLMAASMGCNVIAFEPMTRNAAKISSSVEKNEFQDRITLYQNVAGYESGSVVYMTETHSTNQGNGKISTDASGEQAITIRLDDVYINPTYTIALMKIDVEGHEAAVLNGAKRLICMHIVHYITMEFSTETKQSRECPALEMMRTLHSIGYELSDIVAGAPALPIPLIQSFEDFPPNLLFRLKDTSRAPVFGPNNVICSSA